MNRIMWMMSIMKYV